MLINLRCRNLDLNLIFHWWFMRCSALTGRNIEYRVFDFQVSLNSGELLGSPFLTLKVFNRTGYIIDCEYVWIIRNL